MMSIRFYVMAIGLLVFIFAVKGMVLRNIFVEHLRLKTFAAASGDLSLCVVDQDCLKEAKRIRSWGCVDGVCNGTGKVKKPIACFEGLSDEYSKEEQDQINPLICSFIKSPGAGTRRELLGHTKEIDEDYLVEQGAYVMALKGSAASCEESIKNYIGAWGPQWNFKWYRALSGCRILAHKATVEQEEKNFYTGYGKDQ